MERKTDAELVAILQARDETALREIRTAFEPLCAQIAYQILGSREDAEECINDMLLAVWNSIPPNNPESLRAYVIIVTRRAALDRYKAMQRQKRRGTQLTAALDELVEIIPSDEGVESELDRRALHDAIVRFVQELPAESRRIFIARYYMAMPVKEIAEKYGMGLSAVKVSLMRTRGKLKEYLEEGGFL